MVTAAMRSCVVRLGASRASVSGLMATSTQQRPAAAGRNPRSRGARDARRSGADKLRADAHARPATSRNPEAAGARDARRSALDKLRADAHARRRRGRSPLVGGHDQPARARNYSQKPLLSRSHHWAGALGAPHWPDDLRESPAFAKALNPPIM